MAALITNIKQGKRRLRLVVDQSNIGFPVYQVVDMETGEALFGVVSVSHESRGGRVPVAEVKIMITDFEVIPASLVEEDVSETVSQTGQDSV